MWALAGRANETSFFQRQLSLPEKTEYGAGTTANHLKGKRACGISGSESRSAHAYDDETGSHLLGDQ